MWYVGSLLQFVCLSAENVSASDSNDASNWYWQHRISISRLKKSTAVFSPPCRSLRDRVSRLGWNSAKTNCYIWTNAKDDWREKEQSIETGLAGKRQHRSVALDGMWLQGAFFFFVCSGAALLVFWGRLLFSVAGRFQFTHIKWTFDPLDSRVSELWKLATKGWFRLCPGLL